MVENGGEIKVGERLRRIEAHLEEIEKHLSDRITQHREKNQEAIKELAESIVKDIGSRVVVLEKRDAAEEAVHSYRKWLIGVGVVGIGGLLVNLVMMIQVLGRMH